MGQIARVLIGSIAVLLLLAILLFAGPLRSLGRIALLMPELVPTLPFHPLPAITEQPIRTSLRVHRADADLYLPASRNPTGGMIMTLGVRPLDKRDPLVVRVVEGLARSGIAVMIVQSDDLMAGKVVAEEPENLVQAFQRLRSESSIAPDRVGFFGFSTGGSIAFMAAADPRIARQVRLVGALGALADGRLLVGEVASRSFLDNGARVDWSPSSFTEDVLGQQLIAEDRDRSGAFDSSTLSVATMVRLDAISPLRALERFQSRVFLMVDRSDPLVPYVHSRRLARELPAHKVATYVEFDIFDHVQPNRAMDIGSLVFELWKLGAVVGSILDELEPNRR